MMKIGILSDSHDNIWRLDEAIPHLQQCAAVLHCGDLIAPFMVKRLITGLGDIPVHMVWGNNDGDKRLVSQVAAQSGNFQIYGELAELEIGSLRIAINHYPEIGKALALSQRYDLVCFGHNHTASIEQLNKTVLLNPGEIMGMNGSSTFVIFDVQTKQAEFVDLSGKQPI
jgi:putative phosphoesterase